MRVAVVTGGGRGIGRAIALALGGPDTLVAVAGRTRSQLDAVARELEAKGGRGLALDMDVTSESSVAGAADQLRGAASHVDVLVNNAGVGGGEPVAGSDVARWRLTIDTNLVGTYLVARAVLPAMGNGGRIINLSSVLGRFGVPGYTAYCASKHAVIGFTGALALELAPQQITVDAICPGWVDTEMAEQGMRAGAAASDMRSSAKARSAACRSSGSSSPKRSRIWSRSSHRQPPRQSPAKPTTYVEVNPWIRRIGKTFRRQQGIIDASTTVTHDSPTTQTTYQGVRDRDHQVLSIASQNR